jgi:hypothetical protein
MAMVALFDERELVEKLHRLSASDQQLVVALVERLGRPTDISGKELLERIHDLDFDPEDVQEMEQAINEAFENS